ncbi:MAG: hypothetical protein JSV66_16025 [Trueperaceae bacterium]|nr:MAG: hypothetical protein JSV66_16025 [Trueperaceae bacterium]
MRPFEKRYCFAIGLLLLWGAVLADHTENGRLGSFGTVHIVEQGAGQPTRIEVDTDPAVTGRHELHFYIFSREVGSGAPLRRLIPPGEPGRYVLEIDFPQPGRWGVSMRYGVGLDLYYAFVETVIEPQGLGTKKFATSFRGGLDSGTPRYVQSVGFAVFGLLAIISLVLISAVLRHVKVRQVGQAQT